MIHRVSCRKSDSHTSRRELWLSLMLRPALTTRAGMSMGRRKDMSDAVDRRKASGSDQRLASAAVLPLQCAAHGVARPSSAPTPPSSHSAGRCCGSEQEERARLGDWRWRRRGY